jgi:hypothetical protein
VQVARDAHFQSLALSGETAADHTLFVPRSAGHYFWRVATRDADGRAGEYGEARPLFCEATPPEDLLTSPPDGATVMLLGRAPKLSFAWKAVPGAQSYRLLVFKGAVLRINEVLDRTAHDTTLSVDALEEGEYVWGVWDASERPLFASPHKLSVLRSRARPPSAAPEGGE